MVTVADKHAMWVDLIWDYLHGRPSALPVRAIWDTLDATFVIAASSWNWKDGHDDWGVEIDRAIPGWPTHEGVRHLPSVINRHPVIRWYERTLDPAPMSVWRLPTGMFPAEDFAILREHLSPPDTHDLLSIPYEVGRASHRAFVLARPEDDFTDQELELARWIQPLLVMAGRQAALLTPTSGTAPVDPALTGRELSVLRLAATGATTLHIAHTLGISAATVNTHLTHAYRKLGVNGRIRALAEARRLGLLGDDEPGRR